jgi:ubiquitin C-terminal hydrolase
MILMLLCFSACHSSYMNSFLQVLFSAPEFRRAVLSMRHRDEKKEAASLPSSPKSEETSLAGAPTPTNSPAVASSSSQVTILHELQLLFGHLAWSQKSSFETLPFCRTMRDFDGRPMNIGEQKDVNEFASLLFDQLEQEMKQICKGADSAFEWLQQNQSSQHIIEHNFRGSLVHQIVSLDPSECSHRTERTEQYLMISLPVVNKTTLAASLAAFIEADVLDGDNKYNCDQEGCKKKIAVSKRCCLHDTQLPQYLILHLKRFECQLECTSSTNSSLSAVCSSACPSRFRVCRPVNFDTMAKMKVNSNLEFPYKDGDFLDVEPYTSSGIAGVKTTRPDGFYEYSLVGVLIHGGSAEGERHEDWTRWDRQWCSCASLIRVPLLSLLLLSLYRRSLRHSL